MMSRNALPIAFSYCGACVQACVRVRVRVRVAWRACVRACVQLRRTHLGLGVQGKVVEDEVAELGSWRIDQLVA